MKRYLIGGLILLVIAIGYFNRKTTEKVIIEDKVYDIIKKEPEPEPIIEEPRHHSTRLTSYWVNDDCGSKDITASGKTSANFQLNDKGWYTWNGMLVIATASTRLGRTNQRTYRLYEEIYIKINDIVYKAVVLDVCGLCQIENRIDLYVKDRASMVDQMIEVYE